MPDLPDLPAEPDTSELSEPMQVAGAGSVREEDAFDARALADWLAENADSAGPLSGIPQVAQFSGGASNLTYLLRYPERDLILRRPPAGTKARGAHDMRREHDLQQALRPHFPHVPQMFAHCADESVIGSEFYVMERLEGTVLRQDIPADLTMSDAAVRDLCLAAVDELVALHSVDLEASGLNALSKGEGYVARQVSGWSGRYRKAVTPDVGSFENVMAWLDANQPGDVGKVLIHNDFRFDNLVLDPMDPTQIVGVLDWELATVGDPLMDLGSSLAYWVQDDDDPVFQSFRRQPTNAPGMLTRAEVVARYSEQRGLTVTPEQWRFYEVFGLFRLAVIAQQIYYRFFHGQTSNPAFKDLGRAVQYLEARCERLIA